MSCPICGKYYFDEESDAHFCKELDIMICDDCLKKVEENHKVTGKFVVNKCKCCGNITSLEWVQYKKRGRPAGSKNKTKLEKIDREERAQKRLSRWTGEPESLEEFVDV